MAAAPAGPQAPAEIVILGATLINPSGAPAPNAVIVIRGPRVASVAELEPGAAFTGSGPGAQIIDGRGKFVIPGFADMHNHLGAGGMSLGPQRENYVGNLGRVLADRGAES